MGLRRARELDPSPSLISRRAVDVVKWTEDCVERVGEGGITLRPSSSAVVSIDHPPDMGSPGFSKKGTLGSRESLEDEMRGAEGRNSSWSSMWITGVELRSSVRIEGISGLLPSSIVVEIGGEKRTEAS
jgi:hypothetical protein